MKRLLWAGIATPTVAGLLVFGVFPTRTYLAQRQRRTAAAADVARLTAENQTLQDRVNLLHTDAEVERVAREQYNLVRPGEEAYAILPASPPAGTVPPASSSSPSSSRSPAPSHSSSTPARPASGSAPTTQGAHPSPTARVVGHANRAAHVGLLRRWWRRFTSWF